MQRLVISSFYFYTISCIILLFMYIVHFVLLCIDMYLPYHIPLQRGQKEKEIKKRMESSWWKMIPFIIVRTIVQKIKLFDLTKLLTTKTFRSNPHQQFAPPLNSQFSQRTSYDQWKEEWVGFLYPILVPRVEGCSYLRTLLS